MGWGRVAIRRQPGRLRRPLARGPGVLLPRRPWRASIIAGASDRPITRAGLRGPRQPIRGGPQTRVSGPRGPDPPAAVDDVGPGAWGARAAPGPGPGTRTRVGKTSAAGCGQGEPRAERQRGSEPAELHGERDAVSSDVGHFRHGVGDKSPSVARIEGCLDYSWRCGWFI